MMTSSITDSKERNPSRNILIIVLAVAAVLGAILLLNNTGHTPSLPAQGDESAVNQVAATSEESDPPVAESPPEQWLQAYGSSCGNAAWAPAVRAPFDTLWTLSTGREIFSPPAILGDFIYIAGNDRILRGLNRHTGEQIWSRTVTCGLSGGIAADLEQVYFSGQDGYLYALNRENGSEEWKAGLGYHIFTDACVLSDSLILAGNSMGDLAALNRSSGEVVWSDALEGLLLGPAVSDTIAVFSSENGGAAAWDHTGQLMWNRGFTTQPSPPSISGGRVFLGFSSGKVLALSLATGETIWETALSGIQGRTVVTRPAVFRDSLVVGGTCDGRVFCMNCSAGELLWETGFENWVAVTPAVCDTLVYASCDNGRVYIMNLSNGLPLDTLETDSYSGTPPVLLEGVLYLGTADGDFTALRGTVPEEQGLETICPVE